ncbi:MAG: tetratricopeptide repeat protein [Bacteroidales bacterium]|nr:tetratricopeptide repeat protein [Bacteroidales bacterium]
MIINSIKVSFFLLIVIALFQWSCVNESTDNKEEEKPKNELILLSEKINKDSTDAKLFDQRAQVYLKNNKINQALSDINQALQIDDSNAGYFITLSDIYLKMGEAGKCNNALNKALNLDPKNIKALLKSGELNYLVKNYKKTFELLNNAIKLDKYNPLAYFIKGFSYLELHDTTRAINNFQIAVDQKQDYYDAYIQLGILYLAQNNIRAVGYYKNAINVFPESIEALYGIAMYYQNNNKCQIALDYYTDILKIDSKNTLAYYNSGYIYLVYLNEFEKAIKYFSDAIEISPKYFNAYYNRAYSYELIGDIANARNDYIKTLELVTNHEKAIEGLNRIDKQ